jgi:hypothetical protein
MLTDGRKFDLDLAKGQVAEVELANLLQNGKVEVKREQYQWARTGNIAIEYEFNGKKSGIASTTADFWCHVLCNDYGETMMMLMFPVEKLKEMCRQLHKQKRYRTQSGDNSLSKVILMPIPYALAELCKNTEQQTDEQMG